MGAVTIEDMRALAREQSLGDKRPVPWNPYGKRETRCALCGDSGRVLVFDNGRQGPWFEGYGYAYETAPKSQPCTHTLTGTLGNKRTRRKRLLELARVGKVELADGGQDKIEAQKEL